MMRKLHTPIAWLLIATLSIVAGIGEALHSIPGCGHGVLVGDQVVILGISLPCCPRESDGQPHFERANDFDIPIYSEAQCAICSVVGQSCTSADCVPYVGVMPLLHDLVAVVLRDTSVTTTRSFQARAPPLG